MPKSDTEMEDKFTDSELKFKPASWPKINLQNDIKEDLIRSFNIFDKDGQGVISLGGVEVKNFTFILLKLYSVVLYSPKNFADFKFSHLR